jgi:hypothetical protein
MTLLASVSPLQYLQQAVSQSTHSVAGTHRQVSTRSECRNDPRAVRSTSLPLCLAAYRDVALATYSVCVVGLQLSCLQVQLDG